MSDPMIQRAEKLLASSTLSPEKRGKIEAALAGYRSSIVGSDAPAAPPSADTGTSDNDTVIPYSVIAQESDKAEQELADTRRDLPSASKRMSLYYYPVVEQTNPQAGSSLQWVEPTLEQAYRDLANKGAEDKLKNLARDGEDSDTYKEYCDTQWQKAAMVLQKHGQGAVRLKYLQPRTAGELGSDIAGNIAEPFFGALDDMVSFGAGKQALESLSKPTAAEQELMDTGVLQPLAQRVKAAQSQNMVPNIAGSLAGILTPGGAMKGLSTGAQSMRDGVAAAKWLPGIGKKLTNVGIFGAEGALAETGMASVDALAGDADPDDIVTKAEQSVIPSMLLGGATEALGTAGKAMVKRLRNEGTEGSFAEALNTYEATTGKPMTDALRGVVPPPALKNAADDIAVKAATRTAVSPDGFALHRTAEGTIEDRLKDPIMAAVLKKRGDVKAVIDRENKLYYDSPQGRQYVPVSDLGEELLTLKRRYTGTDNGKTIPFLDIGELDKAIANLEDTATTRAVNDMLREMTEAGKDTSGLVDRINSIPHSWDENGVAHVWRSLNARELDDAIGGLDDKLRAEANRAGGKIPAGFDTAQDRIRSVRDRFAPHPEVAPADMKAVVEDRSGGKKIVSGWSALKNKHHKLQNEVDDVEWSSGLANVSRIEPNLEKQNAVVLAEIRRVGDADHIVQDRVMLNVLKDNPQTLQWLKEVHQTHAYTAVKRQKKDLRVSTHAQGGMSAWVPNTTWFTTRLDPAFRAMQQLIGQGANAVPVMTQITGTGAERNLKEASDIDPAKLDGMGKLVEWYDRAINTGVINDKEEEK